MSAQASNTEATFANQQEAVDAIVNGGVVADGVLAETEGEGRGRRYFLGGENVAKKEVVTHVLNAANVVPADEWEEPEEVEEEEADDEEEDRPLTREEALDVVRTNFEENDGFTVETEDGEKMFSLVAGRPIGYITGSHVKATNAPVDTVADYRALVAEALGVEADEVPIATDEMNDKFRSAGEHSEETLKMLSEMNKARWESGAYDHLRKADDEDEDDE